MPEDIVGTDLDVAGAGAEPSHSEVARYGAGIGSVGEPEDGGGFPVVQAGDESGLQAFEGGCVVVRKRKGLAEGARDRRLVRAKADVEDEMVCVFG